MMLQRGNSLPHFQVRTVQGQVCDYVTLWQRKNLVLVTLPALNSDSIARYVSDVTTLFPEFNRRDTECVITCDEVPSVPCPATVVADRWGEIVCIASDADVSSLPSAQDLLDWIDYIQTRCPECEGETK